MCWRDRAYQEIEDDYENGLITSDERRTLLRELQDEIDEENNYCGED